MPSRDHERRRPDDRDARSAGRAMAEADMLGPHEEIVAGRRPVEEVFGARRPAHRLLVVPHRRQALERIVLHATSLRIPIVEVEGGTLTSLAGFDGHQGVAVVVAPRRYATLEDVLARAIELGEPPFVLALDSLEDPHNVGTLLRSAEAAGVHGVLFPTHRQAPLTPSAVKASAGAVEHLLLCPVDDLASALADLHVRGLRVAGAEADAPLTARQTDLRGPLAIVVGSEGHGLGPAVRRRTDLLMRIPMRGSIDSLNAAVAGSILLFEALAQRDPEGTARPRTPRPLFAPMDAADPAPETAAEPDPAEQETGPEALPASVPAKRTRRRKAEAVPADDAAAPAPAPDAASDASLPAKRTRRRRADAVPPPASAADSPVAETPAEQKSGTDAAVPARPRRAKAAAAPDPAPPKRSRTRKATGVDAVAAAPEVDAAGDDLLPGGPRDDTTS